MTERWPAWLRLRPTAAPRNERGRQRKASGRGGQEQRHDPHASPGLSRCCVLLAWQIGSDLGVIQANVLPSPIAVAAAGWRLARPANCCANVEVSAWRAVVGFAIGGGIGFAFGMATGCRRLSETLTDSTLQMIRNVPHLALIPLVILWFGIGEQAKIFLVALGVFFPIYVNTLHGVRSVDPHLLEMGRAYGMSRARCSCRVVLPGALPSIFVGLRYGLGIMWLTLIVAETISASSGIGFMAMNAREFMHGRRGGVLHPGLRRAGQACRQRRTAAGAHDARLEPGLLQRRER